jgi:hypothetical protein
MPREARNLWRTSSKQRLGAPFVNRFVPGRAFMKSSGPPLNNSLLAGNNVGVRFLAPLSFL